MMNKTEELYDITVIGGGPVGLFTAFYGGMRQAKVKIIESLPQLGGQLSALYPEKYIYDIAGFPKIRAQELVDQLIEQMSTFNQTICLGQSVDTVEKQADGTFKIETNEEVHYSKTIIITAGNGAFQPRKLKIDGVEKYEGANLYYAVNNLSQFKDKNVAIFGGGDSAVDWSLMLEPIAESVSVIHRRNDFRAHEHSVELLKKSKVALLTPFNPTEIMGENQIEKIVLQEVRGEKEVVLNTDAVIVTYGFVSSLGAIKDWNLEIKKNALVVNSKMETNIEGIYAAGDICTYDGKVKLIASGFGEAPIAVSNAKVYMDPKAKLQALHSTTVMEERENKEAIEPTLV